MKLVAFVGTDTSSLGQITALINRMECEQVILVKDSATPSSFSNSKCKTININTSNSLLDLKKEIQEKIKPFLSSELEVALSIASGTGKDHMALISALLNIPVGIKLTAFTKNGVEFIS